MSELQVGDRVVIRSVHPHRKDGQEGYVAETAENSHWGLVSVAFSGDPSGWYAFLPSEVTKTA